MDHQTTASFTTPVAKLAILIGMLFYPGLDQKQVTLSIQALPKAATVLPDRTIRWRVGNQIASFTPPKGCIAVPAYMPDLPEAVGAYIHLPQIVCPQTRCTRYGFMGIRHSALHQPTRDGDGPACRSIQERAKLDCPERAVEIAANFCRTWANNL